MNDRSNLWVFAYAFAQTLGVLVDSAHLDVAVYIGRVIQAAEETRNALEVCVRVGVIGKDDEGLAAYLAMLASIHDGGLSTLDGDEVQVRVFGAAVNDALKWGVPLVDQPGSRLLQ